MFFGVLCAPVCVWWDNEQAGRMTVKYHLFERSTYTCSLFVCGVKIRTIFPQKKCLFCMTASEMPDSNFHGDVWLSCQLISGSYLPILNYFWWLIICMRRIASVCLVIIFEMGNLRIRNDRNQSETVCTWFGHAWLG